MADPIASVETIVRIALAISEAVGTAQRNIDECRDVKTHVRIASDSMRVLQEKGIATDPMVSRALGHLKKTLRHALELVRACREEQNFVERVFKAEDLSSQLRQVKEDISQNLSMATFAINALLAPNANRDGHRQHQDRRHEKLHHHHQRPQIAGHKTPHEHKSPDTREHRRHKSPHEHRKPDTHEHRHTKAHEHHHKPVTHEHRRPETLHEHKRSDTHEHHRRHVTPAHQKPKAQHEHHQRPDTREHRHGAKMPEHQRAGTHQHQHEHQKLQNREKQRSKTPDSRRPTHRRPKMGENQRPKTPAHKRHEKGEH